MCVNMYWCLYNVCVCVFIIYSQQQALNICLYVLYVSMCNMYLCLYIFINTHYDLLPGSLQSFAHKKLKIMNKLITIGEKETPFALKNSSVFSVFVVVVAVVVVLL